MYAILLCALALGGVMAAYRLWGGGSRKVEVDTRLEPGWHLTFAFIAPTSAATGQYEDAVKGGRAAMRQAASAAGVHYSTVGVSDHWSVEAGMELLNRFGPFDEVVVGRNWLNSGVKRYITDIQGEDAVPQVVVILQRIGTHTKPLTYSTPRILLRAVGYGAVLEWQRVKFSLPAIDVTGD